MRELQTQDVCQFHKVIFFGLYILRVFSRGHGVIHTQGFQKLLLQDDVAEPGETVYCVRVQTHTHEG